MGDQQFAYRGDDGSWHAHRIGSKLHFFCNVEKCGVYGGKSCHVLKGLNKHRSDYHPLLGLPIIEPLKKSSKPVSSYNREKYLKQRKNINFVLKKQSRNYRERLVLDFASQAGVSKNNLSKEDLQIIDEIMADYDSDKNKAKRAEHHLIRKDINSQLNQCILSNEESNGANEEARGSAANQDGQLGDANQYGESNEARGSIADEDGPFPLQAHGVSPMQEQRSSALEEGTMLSTQQEENTDQEEIAASGKDLQSVAETSRNLQVKVSEENLQLFMRCEHYRQREMQLNQTIKKLENELNTAKRKVAQLAADVDARKKQKQVL